MISMVMPITIRRMGETHRAGSAGTPVGSGAEAHESWLEDARPIANAGVVTLPAPPAPDGFLSTLTRICLHEPSEGQRQCRSHRRAWPIAVRMAEVAARSERP